MTRKLDAFVLRHPNIFLNFDVDDITTDATSPKSADLIVTITDAANDLAVVLEDRLCLPLAVSKAGTVGNCKDTASYICNQLGIYGGDPKEALKNLGIDYACGKPLANKAGRATRTNRILKFKVRVARFKKLKVAKHEK